MTYTRTDRDMIIQGNGYRISMLTDRLIRLEYSEKNIFTDEATMTVLNRNFEKFDFRVEETVESLVIVTKYLRLIYDKKPFSKEGLKINVNAGTAMSVWYYGDGNESLKGTARTLDGADGEIPLGDGIVSRRLWSVLDDGGSMLLKEDDFALREDTEAKDIYFFGYGHDYLAALKDFYKLSGNVPLLPKYALGNWWSRYYKYTSESYRALIDRFEAENIPFNVAVLDMDWHITEVEPEYGTGWTGYTWNRELFNEPKELLKELHQRNYKVTLNVHPADGVRAFEEVYKDFAEFMGVNTENKDPVLFNIADKKFREGYFKYIHHKLEADGTDFWWIDWQQGENSGVKGLDPLWLLNHFHYKDIMKNNKRGLILSRYAGPGSHRYPVGFSGDTIISWKSLDFQPYFTATASNIGYCWWSHDIGGHMNGIRDDELFARWVQLGVFSPIMRLHSTSNDFSGKEPWKYNLISEKVAKRYLRLRQKLIPYLYTMNLRASREGLPLVLPVYYFNSENEGAYKYRNEYYFGSDLLVCPVTKKSDIKSGLAKTELYLPEGDYVDIFTGIRYSGGREFSIYRDIENIAVFAEAGSVLPLDTREKGNEINNPDEMDLYVFTGGDGEFTLAEDSKELPEFDGKDWRYTTYRIEAKDKGEAGINHILKEHVFSISSAEGDIDDGITERKYNIYFYGIRHLESFDIKAGEKMITPLEVYYDDKVNASVVRLPFMPIKNEVVIRLAAECEYNTDDVIEDKVLTLLDKAQIEYDLKTDITGALKKARDKGRLFALGEISAICTDEYIRGALTEILTA